MANKPLKRKGLKNGMVRPRVVAVLRRNSDLRHWVEHLPAVENKREFLANVSPGPLGLFTHLVNENKLKIKEKVKMAEYAKITHRYSAKSVKTTVSLTGRPPMSKTWRMKNADGATVMILQSPLNWDEEPLLRDYPEIAEAAMDIHDECCREVSY